MRIGKAGEPCAHDSALVYSYLSYLRPRDHVLL